MSLSIPQKKFLRGLGHKLHAVITIGDNGLSDSLLKEFDSTISHHELIKVRVHSNDRKNRDEVIQTLCRNSNSSLITRTGNVALIYRRNGEQAKITLPA